MCFETCRFFSGGFFRDFTSLAAKVRDEHEAFRVKYRKPIQVGARVPAERRKTSYGAARVPSQHGGSGSDRRVPFRVRPKNRRVRGSATADSTPCLPGAAGGQWGGLGPPSLVGRACPTPFCCCKLCIVCRARRLTNSCNCR